MSGLAFPKQGDLVFHHQYGVCEVKFSGEFDLKIAGVAPEQMAKLESIYNPTYGVVSIFEKKWDIAPVRALSDRAGLETAFKIIRGEPQGQTTAWGARKRILDNKYNSGDLELLAQVIRDCWGSERSGQEASYSENQLAQGAAEFLGGELAIAADIPYEQAQEFIKNMATKVSFASKWPRKKREKAVKVEKADTQYKSDLQLRLEAEPELAALYELEQKTAGVRGFSRELLDFAAEFCSGPRQFQVLMLTALRSKKLSAQEAGIAVRLDPAQVFNMRQTALSDLIEQATSMAKMNIVAYLERQRDGSKELTLKSAPAAPKSNGNTGPTVEEMRDKAHEEERSGLKAGKI